MKLALITTTINVPTVLRKYREYADTLMTSDVSFIVAGDITSPHDEIKHLLAELPGSNRYLAPEDQNEWESSEPIGWRCIQRRNIAILEAIRQGAEAIITVDDDNIPLHSNYFGKMAWFLSNRPVSVRSIECENGWFNVGAMLFPGVYHRGYPFSVRPSVNDEVPTMTLHEHSEKKIGVAAGLWLGDPDIDAMERIATRPNVIGIHNYAEAGFTLTPGTWCPFNSQNTGYRFELAPFMMCWPGVGRFDDIWASYLARRYMDDIGYDVHYGHPLVRQERNDHDLYADLEKEIFGYRHTDEVCEALRAASIDPSIEALPQLYAAICALDFIPSQTIEAFYAWMADVKKALKERDELV